MARLTFSYPISREYPYRWLPWVVIIGGSLFTVLFSVFSLATKGYYLEVMFTRNPNITEAELYWFSRAPFSWTDPLSATCQATELQVGTRVLTDKLWRAFTINRVNIKGDNDPNHEVLEPVLVYKNNILENCTLGRVVVHVRNETTLPKHFDMSTEGGLLDRIETWADVSCDVNTNPPAQIQLSAKMSDRIGTWESDSGTIQNLDTVTDTMKRRSGIVTAEFIMWMSDQLVKRQQQLLTQDTVNSSPDLVPAIYQLTLNTSSASITDPSFFYGFKITPSPRGPSTGTGSTASFDDFAYETVNIALPDSPDPPLQIPQTIDRVAKVFYSLLLADLGQPDSTVVTSRDILVAWADDLMEQLNRSNPGEDDWDIVNFWKNATVDMALPWNNSHDKSGADAGEEATPAGAMTTSGGIVNDWRRSTIYTQYTCQVPKQRVTGSVIIAVFVSDLVLLQALWAVFTWATMWWMQRTGSSSQRETVMYCHGCVASLEEGGGGGQPGRCQEPDCAGGGRLKRWRTNTGDGIKRLGRSLTGLTATENESSASGRVCEKGSRSGSGSDLSDGSGKV